MDRLLSMMTTNQQPSRTHSQFSTPGLSVLSRSSSLELPAFTPPAQSMNQSFPEPSVSVLDEFLHEQSKLDLTGTYMSVV